MLSIKQALSRAALYAAPILLLLILILSVITFMSPSNTLDNNSSSHETLNQNSDDKKPNHPEKRAVWLSFLEMQNILKGKSEQEYTASLNSYFDNIKNSGFNTVIFHARSHGDAFYKSSLFPTSVHFTVTRKSNAPFDPLEIAVNSAHERGLKIEAWVNPFRGPEVKEDEPLCANGFFAENLDTRTVFKAVNGGKEYYYLNPADPKACDFVIKGVREIIQNYDVDGIHFDDYFYPVTDSFIDDREYLSSNTKLSLFDYRRAIISDFIATVYSTVKEKDGVTFGISPSGNIEQNMNSYYADVKLWGSKAGFVDYLMPQLYWSYGEGELPFEDVLQSWKKLITSDEVGFAVGLAAYKVGTNDYWLDGNILSRQINDAKKCDNYCGYAIFRYENLFGEACSDELSVITE